MRCFAILNLLLLLAMPLWAQGPAKTTITDTLFNSDGSVFTGKVRIFNSRFTSTDGYTVTQSTVTESVASGAFSVQLVPTQGATPTNTVYTVTIESSPAEVEYWSVPKSSSALKIKDVWVAPPTAQTHVILATNPVVASWINALEVPKTGCGTGLLNIPLQQVPVVNTTVTTTATCLEVLVLNNSNATSVTVNVTDNQGSPVANLTSFELPAHSVLIEPLWGIQFLQGIRWVASASGVSGAMLGLQ